MPLVNRLGFLLLLLLMLWLPIPLGSNRPWAWSSVQCVVALLGMAVAYALWHRQVADGLLRLSRWLWLPLLLTCLWLLLQTLVLPDAVVEWLSPQAAQIFAANDISQMRLSLDIGQTQISLWKSLTLLILMLSVLVLVHNEQRLRWLLWALVLSGVLQAFYAALMVLLGSETSLIWQLPLTDRATGSFVYQNHLANYLLLCLSLGIGLLVAELGHRLPDDWHGWLRATVETLMSPKAILRISLVIMIIALVMTRSRMGNSAFFFSAAICGVLALVFYKKRPKIFTTLIISLFVIDTIIVGAFFGLEKVKERLETTELMEHGRAEVVLWGQQIVKDFPLTGTGGGSFYSVFPMYQQAPLLFYDHAHNEYLQFAIEFGLPITLMLGAMLLYCFYLALQTIRLRNDKLMKGVAFGCMMAIVAMLFHISVDFPLQAFANASTFIVVLTLCFIVRYMPHGGWRLSGNQKTDNKKGA